jgi:hypothetical protein
MRYSASEEIIWLVEQSSLPVKRTLEKLGIPRALQELSIESLRRGEQWRVVLNDHKR